MHNMDNINESYIHVHIFKLGIWICLECFVAIGKILLQRN